MAGKKETPREDAGDGGEGKIKRTLTLIALLFVVIVGATYFLTKPPVETTIVSGVVVKSELSPTELQRMTYISLFNTTTTREELTCKFELSAISVGDPRGYRIKIERGEAGIYLGRREAFIRGMTAGELLKSCHVFACMRDGIECPGDFTAFRRMVDEADSVNIILDTDAGGGAGRGYAELMGVLSYIQAARVDRNGDGIPSQEEINNNTFFIYPYLKKGGECVMQPVHNLVENLTSDNITRSCSMDNAIYLLKSDENRMGIEGSKITLEGSETAVHTQAIILRDSLVPEWILIVYNIK